MKPSKKTELYEKVAKKYMPEEKVKEEVTGGGLEEAVGRTREYLIFEKKFAGGEIFERLCHWVRKLGLKLAVGPSEREKLWRLKSGC